MVRQLNAADIITIWDQGQALHPLDRALLLLDAASPDATPADLSQLTIGQRNGRLLQLRQRTIGNVLEEGWSTVHSVTKLWSSR